MMKLNELFSHWDQVHADTLAVIEKFNKDELFQVISQWLPLLKPGKTRLFKAEVNHIDGIQFNFQDSFSYPEIKS